jgi:glucans biosynthesis protein
MSGEEFPRFTEFWVERPAPQARELRIYALLDSPRATGAYRFVLRPGVDTVLDVRVKLYLRQNVAKLGLAPLTSMYYFGENDRTGIEDFRPEVHDSDGLSVEAGTGEWIWRPLVNPSQLLVSAFHLTNPRGFGLLQRDRHFHNYQDLEARYDLRPSAWVTPTGDWGDGHVMLVEIPSDKEVNDNIVAFWVPDSVPKLGEPIEFAYKIYWTDDEPEPAAIGKNNATYIGDGDKQPYKRFVLDFDSDVLSKLPADADIEGVITVGDGGKLIGSHIEKNAVTGGWRLGFQIDPPDKPLELRVFLKDGKETLSETWSFLLAPP